MAGTSKLDTSAIVVGSSGNVYVAPVATTAPTDLVTALPVTWVDLGYLTPDGVTFSPSLETNEIMSWQSFYKVRTVVTGRSVELNFTMQQWNKFNLPFAFGGGLVATTGAVHKYTPPTAESRDERAIVVEWADGTKNYRLVAPKAELSDIGETNLTRSDEAQLPITLSINAVGTTDPFYILSNDAAWA
jgi:hypothetical protein